MKRKFLCVLAGLTLLLGVSSQVSASINITVGNDPTVLPWSPGKSVQLLDKVFTHVADNLPLIPGVAGDTPIVAELFAIPMNVNGTFTLALNRFASIPQPGTYFLAYKVAITLDNYKFATIALDSDAISNGTTNTTKITKEVFASDDFNGTPILTLSSVNGSEVLPTSLPQDLSEIWVRDTIESIGNGTVLSLSNKFTQKAVPEPASLAVWGGLAVVGLMFSRRRMK